MTFEGECIWIKDFMAFNEMMNGSEGSSDDEDENFADKKFGGN